MGAVPTPAGTTTLAREEGSTRPDIAYSVNMLCRVMSKPNDVMLRHAKRVLRYLHRHKDVGLTYEPAAPQLVGYSDADWGVKHSTTGWIFKWMNGPIAWSSRKQGSVALFRRLRQR